MSGIERYDPKNQIADFVRDGSVPEKLGKLSTEAEALNDVFDTYRGVLKTGDLNGERMLTTPEVSFDTQAGKQTAYFYRPAKFKKGDSRVISCKIAPANSNLLDDSTKFYLNVDTGLALTTESSIEFEDRALLAAAISTTEKALGDMATKKNETGKKRREKIYSAVGGVAVIGAVAGVLTGVGFGIYTLNNNLGKDQREAAAKIIKFDQSGKNLAGKALILGTINVGDLSPTAMDNIPGYGGDDNFLQPHKFAIKEQSCKSFSTLVEDGDRIAIVTSATDSIQNKHVVAGANNLDELTVCSVDSYPGQHTEWTIAVQVQREKSDTKDELGQPWANIGPLAVGDVSKNFFSEIPMYQSGDSLLHPRRFKLNDKTCKTFATPIAANSEVLMDTATTDDIQHRNLVASRNDIGELVVCDPDTYPNEHDSWSLAVQVKEPANG